nr:MAG TPA: hypothetical protein [Caudoviricetes sp.]
MTLSAVEYPRSEWRRRVGPERLERLAAIVGVGAPGNDFNQSLKAIDSL